MTELRASGFLSQLEDPKYLLLLIHGDNVGGVMHAADRYARALGGELRRVMASDLTDPVKALAEWQEDVGLFASRTVTIVTGATDKLTAAVKKLAESPIHQPIVLCSTSKLQKKSSLRTLLEREKGMASLLVQPLSEKERLALLRQQAPRGAQGLDALASVVSPDTLVAMRQAKRAGILLKAKASTQDVALHFAGANAAEFDDLMKAAFTGNHKATQSALQLLIGAGESAYALLRIAILHADRLAHISAMLEEGAREISILKDPGLTVPEFLRKPLIAQAELWPYRRISAVRDRLMGLEVALKNGMPLDEDNAVAFAFHGIVAAGGKT